MKKAVPPPPGGWPADPYERTAEYIRRRDLGVPKRKDIGNAWAKKPGRHHNVADVGGSNVRPTARALAWAAAHRAPPEVAEVLRDGKRYGHRFTSEQWAVLVLAYIDGRTDYRIASRYGLGAGSPSNVRRTRQAAEAIAFELVHVEAPVLAKWHRIQAGSGEELTHEEKNILRRARHEKKGRRDAVSGWEATPKIPGPAPVGKTNTTL